MTAAGTQKAPSLAGAPAQQDPARASGSCSRSRSPVAERRHLGARRARRAPPIDELKPIDKGENSVVFAADGSRLGSSSPTRSASRSSSTRSRRACSRRRSRSRTSTSTSTTASTTRRSSAPRSRTSRPARSVQGGSTITQQLVRNLYIADPEDTIERKIREAKLAEEHRGGAHQGVDPRAVPEHRLLRHQRRPHRGRRRGRRRRLLQQARLRPQPVGGGAARRAAAGALRVQPVPQPDAAPRAPQRRARGDGRAGLHHPARGRRTRSSAGLGLERGYRTRRSASPTSSTTSSRS